MAFLAFLAWTCRELILVEYLNNQPCEFWSKCWTLPKKTFPSKHCSGEVDQPCKQVEMFSTSSSSLPDCYVTFWDDMMITIWQYDDHVIIVWWSPYDDMMLIIRWWCSDDLMIKLVQAESSLPVCITLPTSITTPDPKHSITSDPKQPQGANLVSGLPADQNTNTQHKTQDAR